MPSTLFDSSGLAIVAYAQVDGATGLCTSSGLASNGVSSSRSTTGVYVLTLATGLSQDPSRDLILVQPKATDLQAGNRDRAATLFDTSAQQKVVETFCPSLGSTAVDCSFDVVVLRTILP